MGLYVNKKKHAVVIAQPSVKEEKGFCPSLKKVSWDQVSLWIQQRIALMTACTVSLSTDIEKLFNIFSYQDYKISSTSFSTSCSCLCPCCSESMQATGAKVTNQHESAKQHLLSGCVFR